MGDNRIAEEHDSSSVSSAYIHIPFCRRRCYYCDFPISVVGDRPPLKRSQGISASASGHGSGAIAEYVTLLCEEIQATPTPSSSLPLKTVFFGGGTPSLLGVEQLATILDTLRQTFGIDSAAELSMEMDPGTFTDGQLQGYHSLGINRVSLGVQSFNDENLAACGRVHRVEDIYGAIASIHQNGITSWSLDLISGLPHLTSEQWLYSLHQAIECQPPHISVYDLIIEPNTAFGHWYQPGESPLPSDDTTAQMYRLAQKTLTAAGYHHYEISNYAKPGYASQHNQVYWHNRPYYGFGMGAASYVNHQRVSRPKTRREYREWVQQWRLNPTWDLEPTSSQEQLLDTLMLGLRLAEGLSVRALSERFGEAIAHRIFQTLIPYEQQGWVSFTPTPAHSASDNPSIDKQLISATEPCQNLSTIQPSPATLASHIRLTDPEGFLFSNVVLSTLFDVLEG